MIWDAMAVAVRLIAVFGAMTALFLLEECFSGFRILMRLKTKREGEDVIDEKRI